jgi:PAS domain S-box-containing protein
MNDPLLGNKSKEELEILSQAFQAFTQATEQLQTAYDNLQERVQELDLELARKNEALEKNLREKEEVKNYLHNIMESLTNGVIVVDQENRITTFNKTAGVITTLNPESCVGKKLNDIFNYDLFENLVSRLTQSPERTVSVDREIPGNGREKIPVRVSASPVLDHQQEQIGTVLVVQDMTRLKLLEDEAQRNQRLRAMGEMAAGIAHEIRNPLASMELFATLLKKDLGEDEEKQGLVEHIRAGVKNTDRIISTLLLFAKSPRPARQKCHITSLLSDLLDGDLMIPSNIRVARHFDDNNLTVNGDSELLERVFLNLIHNGIQAMPNGGELSLTIKNGDSQVDPNKEHRKFITVTITDTGTGIAREDMEKIFNPFFSKKNTGTGLGLSISHNIIKAHQGTIDAESREGEKTSFIVKIPAWDEEFDEE